MVLAERSGRFFNVSCQAAISFHISTPCYRHSSIIGTVFHEIDRVTLPIIYHLGGKTVPIILLCGPVWLIKMCALSRYILSQNTSPSCSTAPSVFSIAFWASVIPLTPVIFMRSYGLSLLIVSRHLPVLMFQILMVPSWLPLAMVFPL